MRSSKTRFILLGLVMFLAIACDETMGETNYRDDNPNEYWQILFSAVLIPFFGFLFVFLKIIYEKRKILNGHIAFFLSLLLALSLFCNFVGVSVLNSEMHSLGMHTKANVTRTCLNYFLGVALQLAVLFGFLLNTKSKSTQPNDK
jgi:hypothetical protein